MNDIPPHDPKTERAALGAMMCSSREVVAVGIEMLSAEHFYVPFHYDTFKAIKEIFEAGGIADELTVCDRLRVNGSYRDGFENEVGRMIVEAPSAAAIEDYCQILQRVQRMREAELKAHQILNAVQNDDIERVNELTGQSASREAGFRQFSELFNDDVFDSPPRITSGYATLDSELGGGYPVGSLVFLVAATSDGKSTILRNQLLNVAADVKAALLTLEDSALQARQKLIALAAGVKWCTVENYRFPEAEGGPDADERACGSSTSWRRRARVASLRIVIGSGRVWVSIDSKPWVRL